MFKKYPSIENHYNTKDINRWIKFHPEIEDLEYVIEEKIHGTNVQIIFSPESERVLASRNQIIPDDDSFFGIRSVLAKYEKELKLLHNLAKNDGVIVRVYGEMFGPGIQKGVEYGNEKRFLIFTIEINGKWLSRYHMELLFQGLGIEYMLVPVLGRVKGLQAALDFNVNINSTLHDSDDNTMEGGVIKPYNTVVVDGNGSAFYLKHKTQAFLDKKSVKRAIKDPKDVYRDEVFDVRDTFLEYVNDNTVESVISKHGEFDIKQMGKFIPLVIRDARESFLRENDFDENDFTKNELRFIFNVGQIVAELLKKHQ